MNVLLPRWPLTFSWRLWRDTLPSVHVHVQDAAACSDLLAIHQMWQSFSADTEAETWFTVYNGLGSSSISNVWVTGGARSLNIRLRWTWCPHIHSVNRATAQSKGTVGSVFWSFSNAIGFWSENTSSVSLSAKLCDGASMSVYCGSIRVFLTIIKRHNGWFTGRKHRGSSTDGWYRQHKDKDKDWPHVAAIITKYLESAPELVLLLVSEPNHLRTLNYSFTESSLARVLSC